MKHLNVTIVMPFTAPMIMLLSVVMVGCIDDVTTAPVIADASASAGTVDSNSSSFDGGGHSRTRSHEDSAQALY